VPRAGGQGRLIAPAPEPAGPTELLVISGRSGVGKSSVAAEIHHRLTHAQIWHGSIEGDNLDLAYPTPWEHGLAERNLAAMWANYRSLGHSRLVYANTAAVLVVDALVAALGGEVMLIGVLLLAQDETVRGRLEQREIGSGLEPHLTRSAEMAGRLEREAPDWVRRVVTDGRSVPEVAVEVLEGTGWTD
jgi:broad-specificity NMP kinase